MYGKIAQDGNVGALHTKCFNFIVVLQFAECTLLRFLRPRGRECLLLMNV